MNKIFYFKEYKNNKNKIYININDNINFSN